MTDKVTPLPWTPIGDAPTKPASAPGRVWGTLCERIRGLVTLQTLRFFRTDCNYPSLKTEHTLQVLSTRGRPFDNIVLSQTLDHLAATTKNTLIPVQGLYHEPQSFDNAKTIISSSFALTSLTVPQGEKRYLVIPISTPPQPEKVQQYKKIARRVALIFFPLTIALGALLTVAVVLEALLLKLPTRGRWPMHTFQFAQWLKNPLIGHITTGLIEVENRGGQLIVNSVEHFDLKGLRPDSPENKLLNSEETAAAVLDECVAQLKRQGFQTPETHYLYQQTGLQTSYDVKSKPNVHQCGWGVALYAKLRVQDGLSPQAAVDQLKTMDLEAVRLVYASEYALHVISTLGKESADAAVIALD